MSHNFFISDFINSISVFFLSLPSIEFCLFHFSTSCLSQQQFFPAAGGSGTAQETQHFHLYSFCVASPLFHLSHSHVMRYLVIRQIPKGEIHRQTRETFRFSSSTSLFLLPTGLPFCATNRLLSLMRFYQRVADLVTELMLCLMAPASFTLITICQNAHRAQKNQSCLLIDYQRIYECVIGFLSQDIGL